MRIARTKDVDDLALVCSGCKQELTLVNGVERHVNRDTNCKEASVVVRKTRWIERKLYERRDRRA